MILVRDFPVVILDKICKDLKLPEEIQHIEDFGEKYIFSVSLPSEH